MSQNIRLLKSFSKPPLLLAAVAFSSCITSAVYACSSESYMGTICETAANYCPNGTLPAQGQALQIRQYQALYSLLGIAYGGDGVNTFQLPDYRGRSSVGVGKGNNLATTVIQGEYRGAETVTQTIAQMPPHTHIASVTGDKASLNVTVSASPNSGHNVPLAGDFIGAGSASGQGQAPIYVSPSSAGATVQLGGVTVTGSGGVGSVTNSTTGSGQPMAILPPQVGMLVCIVTQGLYPPRPN